MKLYVEFFAVAFAIWTIALVHCLPHSDDNEYTFGECSQHCPSSGEKCSTCCANQSTRFKAEFSSCRSRRCLCRTRSLYIAETFEGFEEYGGDTSIKKFKPNAPALAPSYVPAPRPPTTTTSPPIYTRAPTTSRAPIYTRAPTTTKATPSFTRAPTTKKALGSYSQGLAPSAPKAPPTHQRRTPRPSVQKHIYFPKQIDSNSNTVSTGSCELLCPRQEFNCSKCCRDSGFNIRQSGCQGRQCVCNH